MRATCSDIIERLPLHRFRKRRHSYVYCAICKLVTRGFAWCRTACTVFSWIPCIGFAI